MSIRPFAVAFIALSLSGPVLADEDPASVIPEAAPLRDRWERCAANKVRPLIRGNLSAEAVADRALAACKSEENAVKDLLVRRVGSKQAFTVLELVRKAYRMSLAGVVEKVRAR